MSGPVDLLRQLYSPVPRTEARLLVEIADATRALMLTTGQWRDAQPTAPAIESARSTCNGIARLLGALAAIREVRE